MAKLRTDAASIAASFKKVVEETQALVDQSRHPNAVDIKIEFRSVDINKSGVPIFSRKKKEATTEIHFATRITLKENE